jgi:hypothetical protein
MVESFRLHGQPDAPPSHSVFAFRHEQMADVVRATLWTESLGGRPAARRARGAGQVA